MTISKMTDVELVRAIAEEVMGWRWEAAGYDWAWFTGSYTHLPHGYNWNPLYDYNHTFQVVERMRELGWNCNIFICSGKYEVLFSTLLLAGHIVYHENLKRAILEAALEAVREMK